MAGQNVTMSDDLPQLLSAAENAEAIVRELAHLILGESAEFDGTCERANRICDRYYLPNAA